MTKDKDQKKAIADLKKSAGIASDIFHTDDIAEGARLIFESCFFADGKIDEDAVDKLRFAVTVAEDLVPEEDVFDLVGEIFDDGEVHEDLVEEVLKPSKDIACEVFGTKVPTLDMILVVAAKVFGYDPDGEDGEEE